MFYKKIEATHYQITDYYQKNENSFKVILELKNINTERAPCSVLFFNSINSNIEKFLEFCGSRVDEKSLKNYC